MENIILRLIFFVWIHSLRKEYWNKGIVDEDIYISSFFRKGEM